MCRRISYRAGESERAREKQQEKEKEEQEKEKELELEWCPAVGQSDSDFFRDWFLCIILITKICAS